MSKETGVDDVFQGIAGAFISYGNRMSVIARELTTDKPTGAPESIVMCAVGTVVKAIGHLSVMNGEAMLQAVESEWYRT